MTEVQDRMYFYDEFAEEFDSAMNMYDTNKRISVIYNELLTEDLSGKELLDAGCGTGWFSKKAVERGANVTSMDIGQKLLDEVKKKCNSNCVVGSILGIPFGNNTFDIVVSSEVIEHTIAPLESIAELYRVLKPGGVLILTTPNKLWFFSIWIANKLKLRSYYGFENWISWQTLKREATRNGFKVEKMVGIHLFPFVSPLFYPILNFFHRFNKELGPLMLNMAIR